MSYERKYQCNKCGDVTTVAPDEELTWATLKIGGAELFGPTAFHEAHLCRPCVRQFAELIPSLMPDLERFFDCDGTIDLSTKEPIGLNSDPEHVWKVLETVDVLAFEGHRLVIDNPSRWQVFGLVVDGRYMIEVDKSVGIPATVFGPDAAGSTTKFSRARRGANVELVVRYLGNSPNGERLVARLEGRAYGFAKRPK